MPSRRRHPRWRSCRPNPSPLRRRQLCGFHPRLPWRKSSRLSLHQHRHPLQCGSCRPDHGPRSNRTFRCPGPNQPCRLLCWWRPRLWPRSSPLNLHQHRHPHRCGSCRPAHGPRSNRTFRCPGPGRPCRLLCWWPPPLPWRKSSRLGLFQHRLPLRCGSCRPGHGPRSNRTFRCPGRDQPCRLPWRKSSRLNQLQHRLPLRCGSCRPDHGPRSNRTFRCPGPDQPCRLLCRWRPRPWPRSSRLNLLQHRHPLRCGSCRPDHGPRSNLTFRCPGPSLPRHHPCW